MPALCDGAMCMNRCCSSKGAHHVHVVARLNTSNYGYSCPAMLAPFFLILGNLAASR